MCICMYIEWSDAVRSSMDVHVHPTNEKDCEEEEEEEEPEEEI